MNPFQSEPALSAGFVMALITVAVAFGAPISPEQSAALQQNLPIILAGIGALAVWIRQMVTPNAKVEERAEELADKEVSRAYHDGLTQGAESARRGVGTYTGLL